MVLGDNEFYLCPDTWGFSDLSKDSLEIKEYKSQIDVIRLIGSYGLPLVLFGAVHVYDEEMQEPYLASYSELITLNRTEKGWYAQLTKYNMKASLEVLSDVERTIARRIWYERLGIDIHNELVETIFHEAASIDTMAWYSFPLFWTHVCNIFAEQEQVPFCTVVPYREGMSVQEIAFRAFVLSFPDVPYQNIVRYLVQEDKPLRLCKYMIISSTEIDLDNLDVNQIDKLSKIVEKKLA